MDTIASPLIQESSFQQAKKRFLKSISGRVGLVLTIAIVLLALLAPVLRPFDPATARDFAARLQPPSLGHWFGTDGLGRDMLSLVWYGIRVSLLVSLVSVILGLLIGTFFGLIAGYFRGWLERVIGWMTDILLAFPSILLAIAIATVIGASLQSVMIAVGVVEIPKFIRLTRSMVLSLREQGFVQTVRAFGAKPGRIIFNHILPSSLAPIVVQSTLSIGTATLEAAGLGFLGLGAKPPTPELGTMLSDSFTNGYALSAPWTILMPGLMITLIVLAFNLLGDGLRDSLDPRGNR
ncbi:MAG: ABC transporter permease [Oscillatoriophycideae cyanobacterium NC_groundwater_1537_Pr4_S-0.65um_50_18]|nr:ABC transporter permease [Oscillatoriophycideae cyanobacterium NC_groundwater_1537_Pr4_S-0.65um_50_18]